jgi:hypothetical protein
MNIDLDNPDIFELNDFSNMKIINFEGRKLFYMDNFYKYPDLVFQSFDRFTPPVWKQKEQPSRNMIDFEDRRHILNHKGMINVYKKLENLCKQKPISDDYELLITNYTRFKKCSNNDYTKKYWWPHYDTGYNGIIYFNDDNEYEGTYGYKLLDSNMIIGSRPEHEDPWTLKEKWEVIFKIKAKYNRFVMFDGKKYPHGMSLFDDRWFSDELENAKFRINQVVFFTDTEK